MSRVFFVLCLSVMAVSAAKTFNEEDVVAELTTAWKHHFGDLAIQVQQGHMKETQLLINDSLRAEISVSLEDFFEIELPDTELEKLHKFDDFKDAVIKKLKEAGRFQ